MIKAICLLVDYYRDGNCEYYKEELVNLAVACNFEVVDTFYQKMEKINSKHYFNSGKINEIAEYVNINEIDLIIVNNEISGMQNKNVETICQCKVIDRTQLILEIFSSRAKTKEAQLQVSIAKLKYQKPRMIGSYDKLSRQGGGSVGTISRGGGEKKIDLDKRKIDKQISEYQHDLNKFIKTRDTQRKKRKENKIPIVSLVGYTNAGKSTLMNYLSSSEKEVFAFDMLFATLDTSVRKVRLDNDCTFLLVDTVGFVSNLPHELVKAFRSTLEEICESDLIIHLNDISDPNSKNNINVVDKTLKNLKVDAIDKVFINNKLDLVNNYNSDEIAISIHENINIDVLIEVIKSKVFNDYEMVELLIKYDQLNLINEFKEFTNCQVIEYLQSDVHIKAYLPSHLIGKYKNQIKR